MFCLQGRARQQLEIWGGNSTQEQAASVCGCVSGSFRSHEDAKVLLLKKEWEMALFGMRPPLLDWGHGQNLNEQKVVLPSFRLRKIPFEIKLTQRKVRQHKAWEDKHWRIPWNSHCHFESQSEKKQQFYFIYVFLFFLLPTYMVFVTSEWTRMCFKSLNHKSAGQRQDVVGGSRESRKTTLQMKDAT